VQIGVKASYYTSPRAKRPRAAPNRENG